MKTMRGFEQTIAVAVASGLGILIGLVDRAEPFGDDSTLSTIALWLACSGLLGFAMPRRPWLWAVSVGPWLPAMYLVLLALGFHDPLHPNNTYTTGLILIGLSLVVCAVGAYAGALVRRIIGPPSRPVEAPAGTAERLPRP
jgi:hypothetical protein